MGQLLSVEVATLHKKQTNPAGREVSKDTAGPDQFCGVYFEKLRNNRCKITQPTFLTRKVLHYQYIICSEENIFPFNGIHFHFIGTTFTEATLLTVYWERRDQTSDSDSMFTKDFKFR